VLGTDCTDCGPIPSNEGNNEVDLLDPNMCTDGLYGTALPGDQCVFPFTYNGEEYNACTKNEVTDAAVKGWCATSADFDNDELWGSCQYCYDVNADTQYYYYTSNYYYQYEYQYDYVEQELTNDDGSTSTTTTKAKSKVSTKTKKGMGDVHGGDPGSSTVAGAVLGILGLLVVAGVALLAYKKFAQSNPSSGGGYGPVGTSDVELANFSMGMKTTSVPITPDHVTTS